MHVPIVRDGCIKTPTRAPKLPGMTVLLGASVAFFAIFGIFLAAAVFLIVWVVAWVIRRDIAGRKAWMREQADSSASAKRDEEN